ncbi:MAG: hypothetical protein ACRD2W_13990 [Acidimicrobiales bacterium]
MRTSSFVPADEPFFREWTARRLRSRRSLARAAEFAARLGLDVAGVPPPLTVVGSKGKGTTATYASATLAAKGLRVGTITSPGYRTNRERIRVDGSAISTAEYEVLSAAVASALPAGPARDGGYLSPTGLFTLAGAWWLVGAGCDALVLEAGIGGGSDEVSLFTPRTVAITRIFDEHVGILGATVYDIVREKAAVVRPETRSVWTIPQDDQVHAALLDALGRISTVSGHPTLRLPPGLSGRNAALGFQAAADHAPGGTGARVGDVLDTISLPGRLSVHHRPGGQTWIVDSAIDPVGVRAALDWCRPVYGEPSSVVVAFPDGKRPAACRAELAGCPVVPVATENRRLTFDDPVWDGQGRPLPVLASLDLDALGPLVLALGTISFVGEVLETLDVPTERSFRP